MTIKQQGGIFGRNPTFNDVDINGSLTTQTIDAGSYSISGGTINGSSFDAAVAGASLNLGVTGNTSVKYIKFNEATDWSIQSNGSSYLRIYSGGSEAARFDGSQNFSMLNGGNIKMASGNGIDFSATSGTGTSELFDDYEEGTWTPAGNGITLSSASGTYTKIGDTVHAYFGIVFPTTSDTGNAQISGLPFTAGTSIRNGAALGFVVDSGTAYSLLAYNSVIQIYNRSGVLTTNANNSAKQYYGVLIYKAA